MQVGGDELVVDVLIDVVGMGGVVVVLLGVVFVGGVEQVVGIGLIVVGGDIGGLVVVGVEGVELVVFFWQVVGIFLVGFLVFDVQC